MNLFHEIIWWSGVTLFVTAATMFYSLLGYGIFLHFKDKLKKYLQ